MPGPTLRATEGDRVIINFINNGKLPHTMHFHGDHDEKNDGVFQEVLPGDSYTYDFIAEPAGLFMYHCHVMPVSEHIRNGLYGAFIVDPKEGLEPAREYVLVKGEYDLEDQDTWNPDYVFFNGYADQYWSNPLPAKTNELVRLYYVDMGAIPAFGFHIHGTIFDTIISGIWDNDPIRTQTWEVGPGNAAIFEAKWKEPGRYLFHLHGVPEEKGTMAYFDVKDASPDAVDGVDIVKTKSIDMWEWQKQITNNLQQPDANAKITKTSTSSVHEQYGAPVSTDIDDSQIIETNLCDVETDSAVPSSNKSFYPKINQAKVGDTVTWTNKDTSVHTITSNDDLFDSGMMMPDDTFEQTFDDIGLYEYYCMLHPWMTGTVKIK
jgi:nitrite reductase (NO-forming)